MASLSAVIDRFSAPRFIIPDRNGAAYVCDYFLEEGTHQLIMFLLIFSSTHLCRSDYSSWVYDIGIYLLHLWSIAQY